MRKHLFITASVLIIGLVIFGMFVPGKRDKNRIAYDGKSMDYWEQQAFYHSRKGDFATTVLPAMQKIGHEAVPFWLERLQARDSRSSRLYSRLWPSLPASVGALLPEPISQRTRRNVAYSILSQLHLTNGTPELIKLTYSNDAELQFYAVDVLWWRAYRGLEPSRECITAFCTALKVGDARTRLSAVQGLNSLPVWPEALPALELALKDPEEEIRVKAAVAILKLKPDYDLQHIFQAGLTSSNHNARVISKVELSNLRRR